MSSSVYRLKLPVVGLPVDDREITVLPAGEAVVAGDVMPELGTTVVRWVGRPIIVTAADMR